jgi:hypothetical protein
MNSALGRKARFPVRDEGAWFAAGLTMILCAAAVALVRPLSLLFRVISRSYNEGWNAFWADAAARGSTLYLPADSLISNNYPPLSFHLVGFVGGLLGDNVIAGRLVSLASFAVVILTAYLLLRAMGTTRQIAITGALCVLVTFSYYGDNYVAMNDPQMLGHAFMLSAAVLLWRLDFSRVAVIAGAVLMLLGGFTKHLLIPLPVAVTLWMLLYRRDRVGLWALCFAVGVPLGFWLTSSRYPLFVQDLIASRVYLTHQAVSATTHALARFSPLLILGALPLLRGFTPQRAFVLIYLALSLVVGAIAAGGDGVARNAFFDLLIAASLFAALGLAWLWEHSREPRVLGLSAAPAAVMFLGVGMSLFAIASLPKTVRAMRAADALEQETRTTVAMIARLGKGRAACETLALCYWARGRFTLDFFNYGQKLRTGAVSVESCTAALQRGDFAVLQLETDHSPQGRRLWPCTPAIRKYYTEAYRSQVATLLVPKQSLAGL